MILTGPAIAAAVAADEITIDPFEPARLSPNAYDWRLGKTLRVCDGDLDAAAPTRFTETTIPQAGFVLEPGVLYLGVTHERTGSERFAQILNGDRTVGSLGIWVHVSAPLGHQGHAIRWTLEIRAARPVRVRAGMTFGKLVFVTAHGDHDSYQRASAKYAASDGIDISRLYEEITGGRP
ncbi:deoxycytidine triphosphate deaminase [Streptomyces sp. MBT56]|uniref:dCTP deaminase n=1 Tax=unclassified Streptomyces TaxID=2593676 RepID=UPI00190D2D5C|nr:MULTISPECIES: deoxycytidine triphosphate deaminase [unclassified Streptomyces]MBK3533626.1 deoxycytidine triphosphate deaminase [Streptomyces sp. MBT72]MBK3538099.1 deoxycytidine triphosphate deaminase [Streptomyces sp. MBT67]MBK3552253.1 deoxycytidine triphosphate deaminase [Streptomyces sp. MBT61]MBK3560305.1 deoxycytidine triphosphate deaminase [Streptomyces sp. MBT56]MBK3599971.1 deoxycytidine triphosphate deaminase [Streptomyces sp. MBT54]